MVRDEMLERGLGHFASAIVAIPDKLIEHGTQPLIRGDIGLDSSGIVTTATRLMQSRLKR